MAIIEKFQQALNQCFTEACGSSPEITITPKSNVMLDVEFKNDTKNYTEKFDFAEMDCMLRNTYFSTAFAKRVMSKLN